MSDTISFRKSTSIYPEQRGKLPTKIEDIWQNHVLFYQSLFPLNRTAMSRVVQDINAHKHRLAGIDDREINQEIQSLRTNMRSRDISFANVCQAFALIREKASRNLDLHHHDVQLQGGWALLHGNVVEMKAGEGKTLTATLPACTLAMSGIPTHVITASQYLADRDYMAMKPLYESMGISVALLKHGMLSAERRHAYLCDVVYCSARELVFDYLKDHLIAPQRSGRISRAVQRLYGGFGNSENHYLRGLHFAIIDDADTVLIDQALTPVAISGEKNNIFDEPVYRQALRSARQLELDSDFMIGNDGYEINFTDQGKDRCAELSLEAGGFWNVRRIREMLLLQALTALNCLSKDVHYSVQNHKVAPLGRVTEAITLHRMWSSGLQQMVECKEGCPITSPKDTLARITFQRFFRRYYHLAGITGTANEARRQFWSIYRLKVAVVPPSRPDKCRRLTESCLTTSAEKLERLVSETGSIHRSGRPVLIGSVSADATERISAKLTQSNLPHTIVNGTKAEPDAASMSNIGNSGQITITTSFSGPGIDLSLASSIVTEGGLHIIASEKNIYGRLDRQLIGNCGKQGEPGSYSFFFSLEDGLFQKISIPLLRSLLSFTLNRYPSLGHYLVMKTSKFIQRQLASQHYRRCRTMLRHEDSLDRQLAFSGEGE